MNLLRLPVLKNGVAAVGLDAIPNASASWARNAIIYDPLSGHAHMTKLRTVWQFIEDLNRIDRVPAHRRDVASINCNMIRVALSLRTL